MQQMTSPAKSRSRSIAGVDPRMGHVVNDNTPPAFPGHELSDLDGVSRPPAAEAVIHYSRLTQIASYPMHPAEAAEPTKAAPVMDALPEQPRRGRPAAKKRSVFAGFCSVVFHVAVFAALMTATVTIPEEPQEEAGDTLSVVMLGDSDADQLASGEKSEVPEPKPDEVVAETVQPDVVQPTTSETAEAAPVEPTATETPPVDAAQPVQPAEAPPEPVQPDQVQPTQSVTQVSPETVISSEPEVLAAQAPAQPGEPSVVQPMATEVQPEEMKPAEAPPSEAVPAETQPETVQPTETAETPPPVEVTPLERPKPPVKAVQKPKDVVKKQPPKPVKVKSGSGGDSVQDAKKGSSAGTEVSQSNNNSESDGHRSGMGGAAEANYLGKVNTRIGRCVRSAISSEYKKGGASASVRLTSNASGTVISASMVHSSGIPGLDSEILGAVRSCDLPPLPDDWGKPTRALFLPFSVTK